MMSISRSTASLDSFHSESSVDKLSRLSKSYSLTNLSKRKRSSSSEKTFDKDTLSSRNKLKVNRKKSSESPRDRTLTRLSKNIERDRNSEQVFSRAYRERCKGIMNQTTSRSESKKRDSAALSGSAGRTRLPPISKPTKQTAPDLRSAKTEIINNGQRVRSGRNVNEDTTRRARTGREDVRKKSGRQEENNRGQGRNFAGAVNRANPARGLAGTVKHAIAANRVNKPADDVKLNKKYAGVVCETCKLQIHEKLKRGYAKYRSLEKMKACEKCQKSVIDFDFYQICIDCAKDLRVCAKCASGSTMISGERFVQVVRHGVEENILSMSDRELSQFAKKHAKIGVVEQKISTIENETSDKSAATTRTPSARSSARSRRTSSAKSNKSSKKSPTVCQVDAKVKAESSPEVSTSKTKKVSKNARSMTSSSSPLVGGESETETCLSSTESDEAYGSGHISSVSDVKTVRSATKSNRTRHKSSEILRQIRSLTTVQVTSPAAAQSVIREIRSLTEMDYYDDDDKSTEGERPVSNENKARSKAGSASKRGTPVPSPQPSYTPFSGTSDKSNMQEDNELQEYMSSRSRTPTVPSIKITGTVSKDSPSHPQLEATPVGADPQLELSQVGADPQLELSQVGADPQLEAREYSPSPPVVTITTVTKVRVEDESSSDSSEDCEVEDDSGIICEEVQSSTSSPNPGQEVAVQQITNVGNEAKSEDETIEDVNEASETECSADIVQHESQGSDRSERGPTRDAHVVAESQLEENEIASIDGSSKDCRKSIDNDDNNPHDVANATVPSGVQDLVGGTSSHIETSRKTTVTETKCDSEETEPVLEVHILPSIVEKTTNEVPADDLAGRITNSEVENVESIQISGGSNDEAAVENTVFMGVEGEDLKTDAETAQNLVNIEDVPEEEAYQGQASPRATVNNLTAVGGEILRTVENTTDNIVSGDEEVTNVRVENQCIDESVVDETQGAQCRQVYDVRVEDVDDDQHHSISITHPNQIPAEELDDDSSDSTDEARLSSELETFLGDTPKSMGSEDSPRNHHTGSQEPSTSSTEVQISSSASEADRQADRNSEDVTPRSRKPVFQRQLSEDNESESVLETVGENFDFSQFHQNHAFEMLEIHKNSPEEILYEEEEDYYDKCYQYQYSATLRIRLEDIPEEGTLSKESTYLSHPFTDTLDKEDTTMYREESILEGEELQHEHSTLEKEDEMVEKEPSTAGEEEGTSSSPDSETSVEVVINDIVNCALIKASLSLMDEKKPNIEGRSS